MRKRTLGIIGGSAAIVVLGGAVAALSLTAPSDADTAEEESVTEETDAATVVTLTSEEPENVSKITISGVNGDFTINRVQEATEDDDAVYNVEGWEDLPQNTSVLWTLANNTASFETSDLVEENCTDLQKFGLDESNCVHATLYFDDNTSYSFRLGNTVADTDYTYFAPEDEDTVYTVKTSLVANFKKTAEDFLSTTVLEEPEDDEYPIVNYLTIERKDMDYEFRLDYDESANDEDTTGGTAASHVMTEPIDAYLSLDRSTPVVTGMFGLSADSIAYIHPEEADLEATGLDDPFGTAVMDCDDGNTYVLNIGDSFQETDEDTGDTTTEYYFQLEGINAIYTLNEDDLVWATVTPTDVASKLVLASYVWDIGTLDVSMEGGEDFHFEVSGDSQNDAVVTLNGTTTDNERYRGFYAFLLNTTGENVELDGEFSGTPLASIHATTQTGLFDKQIDFYGIDDFEVLIVVDGKSAFTCRKSFLDTLEYNMGIYDTDEEYKTNWS